VADIRRHGSGTIGATNVLRTAGRLPGIVTLLGDIVKGYVAVALAGWIEGGAPRALAVGAVAAVIGNCWSVFLGFRGGKGVATGLGALLKLTPLATLAAVPVFLVVVVTTRFGALALGAPRSAVAGTVVVAAIVVLRHRENIARLRAGTERRLGERRASGAGAPAP
jgi:glycerol-3-phosphate acyltransferase PlsY